MNCPKCGWSSSEPEDTWCFRCGVKLEEPQVSDGEPTYLDEREENR